jgi:hypothetical protein
VTPVLELDNVSKVYPGSPSVRALAGVSLAWMRIAARGLTHQAKTLTSRDSTAMATRDQHVNTTSPAPARRPHRARGAALGAGFHLHAHATSPREPGPQSRTSETPEDP